MALEKMLTILSCCHSGESQRSGAWMRR